MAAPWPAETGVLKVRMGLHTDEAVLSDGQYVNAPLNRCARLMAAAHGGQILVSDATEALARSQLPDGAALLDLGEHRLRDLAGRCTSSSSPTRTCQARFPRCGRWMRFRGICRCR